MARFVPRSIRGTDQEAQWVSLRQGIPSGMDEPLRAWVERIFYRPPYGYVDSERFSGIAIDLDMDLTGNPWSKLNLWMTNDPDRFFDIVDWCLHQCSDDPETAIELERLLVRGSSATKVAHVGDHFELQDRIDSTVEQAAKSAAAPGSASAHHLALAWSLVYGQNKIPNASYADAVLAAEFVVCAVVIPKDPQPSLGKAIPALRDAPTKFQSTLGEDGIEAAIAMMKALWRQHKRHAGTDSTEPIVTTQEEAEAAVHLAATLVHWFTSGVVSRR
jgi:hypothetical protein